MSKRRLGVLMVSTWIAAWPAVVQTSGVTSSFAATADVTLPLTLEFNPASGMPEISGRCTYQGGPKSGLWVCR